MTEDYPSPVTTVTAYDGSVLWGADALPAVARTVRVRIGESEHLVDIEYMPAGKQVPTRQPLSADLFSVLQPNMLIPMRPMVNSHWKTNKPGLQYFLSTRQLVAYESRLEAFNLLLLDWEGRTAGIQGQPFTIHFRRSKRPAAHTPDFLIVDQDGCVTVINVKPTDKLTDPRVVAQFDATEQVCQQVGWTHRVMASPSDSLAANLRLLAGFRRPPAVTPQALPAIEEALQDGPRPVREVIGITHAATGSPELLIRPVLLHALWTREVLVDLEQPLSDTSLVARNREKNQ